MIQTVDEIKELTYDTIFKAVFRKRQEVLIKMIKDIFDIKEDYNNPLFIAGYESVPLTNNGKTYKSDILIKLSDNTYISVEMNRRNGNSIISRNIIQMARIYTQINEAGDSDSVIPKKIVKGLNINTFKTFAGKPVEKIALCEVETGKIISSLLSFCNIDVALCRKLVYNLGIENVSKAIRWGAILQSNSLIEISNILGDDILSMEEKEKFLGTMREITGDERVMKDWMWEEHYRLKEQDELETALAEGLEKGYKKGVSEGRKKGHQKGLKEGLKEGMERMEKNLENVIQNMINKNIDYQTISEVTGKDIDTIKKIEKRIKN